MKNIKNPFASKEYHFLFWLSKRQILVSGRLVIKLSQKELAAEYKSCETTINRWLTTLKNYGCITSIKKGAYCLTPKGREIIDKMQAVEAVLGGIEYAD